MDRLRMISTLTLGLALAMGVMGCASTSLTPVAFEKVERFTAELPGQRITVTATESKWLLQDQEMTWKSLRQRLAVPDPERKVVYCVIEKSASIQNQQLEELASVVIWSGGRFFYHYARGAIDNLGVCTELVKER